MKYILRITTWRGLDYDAVHYYGSVRPQTDDTVKDACARVDMEHSVEATDERYFRYYYTREEDPGKMRPTSRFLTTEDVLAEALRWMKENHPEDTLEVRDETDGE